MRKPPAKDCDPNTTSWYQRRMPGHGGRVPTTAVVPGGYEKIPLELADGC